jgi:hypothetical protein
MSGRIEPRLFKKDPFVHGDNIFLKMIDMSLASGAATHTPTQSKSK